MPFCGVCGYFAKKSLLLHISNTSECRYTLARRSAADIPKVVDVSSKSILSQVVNGNVASQPILNSSKCCAATDSNKRSSTRRRQSSRTTIVAHDSNCFGQRHISTQDGTRNDMSTVAMNSITPGTNDYWCRVDEFMESGDLDDLCPDIFDNSNDIDVHHDSNVFDDVADASIGMEEEAVPVVNDNNRLRCDHNVYFMPVHESVMASQFSVEERLLTRVGRVCCDANAPLYLVDEIMGIFQDECKKGLKFDRIQFHKRESFMNHLTKRFATPKAHVMHIRIESLHPNNMEYIREFCD